MPGRWMRACQPAHNHLQHAAISWSTCFWLAQYPRHMKCVHQTQHYPMQHTIVMHASTAGCPTCAAAARPHHMLTGARKCPALPRQMAHSTRRITCLAHSSATQEQAAVDVIYTREGLMSLKVVELQALLAQHGAPKSGKKEVLAERLLALQQSNGPAPATTVHATSSQPAGNTHADALQAGSQSNGSQSNGSQTNGSQTNGSKTKRGQQATAAVQEAHTRPQDMPVAVGHAQAQPTGGSVSRTRRADGRRSASIQQEPDITEVASNIPHASSTAVTQAADRPNRPAAAAAAAASSKQSAVEQAVASSAQDALPPIPVLRRGRSWAAHEHHGINDEELKNILQANPSDMQLAVLGTAAVRPSPSRALASIAFCRSRDVWLFDAGDDTQRQLGALSHVKPSKVYRIFITSLVPETLLGLPGLLCSINAARARGHEITDIPLHIYGPEGLADFLAPIFQVSNTYFEVAMLIVELARGPVEPELRTPELYNRRARMYRAVVPPDQLNPDGYFDGDLSSFTPTKGRAYTMKGSKSGGGVLTYDKRAGFLPFPAHTPGDPSRHVAVENMTWTIDVDVAARMTAVALPSSQQPVFAYAVQEADRAGQVVVGRADALGVPRGRSLALLKDGMSVMNKDGKEVTPAMVLTASKPGRKVVIMGNAHNIPSPHSAFTAVSQSADLLVSGWVDAEPAASASASSSGCLPAGQLGRLAAELRVQHLLLSRFNSAQCMAGPNMADGATEEGPQQALKEAEAAAAASCNGAPQQSVRVDAAADFWVQVLEKHEGPAPALA